MIVITLLLPLTACNAANEEMTELAKPLQKQINFADWEVGAFLCYDLNQFIHAEHHDGQEPPSKFNPTALDVDQWIRTAKSMGAKYAVITARHEGGFCLWPSKTTDYTIANSPYKNGKGDIVREYVDACRRHGIKVGLYHTASHDAHATLGGDYKSWGKYELPLKWTTTWGQAMGEAHRRDPGLKERYKKIQLEQMRELLTWYGPIDYMWSDHWNAKDRGGVWYAISKLVEELQPDMVFHGMDAWVPGNETGHVVYPMWNAIDTEDGTIYSRPAPAKGDLTMKNTYGLLEGDVRSGSPYGKFWRMRECTTNTAFAYGGWFWHPDHIRKTYPRQLWEHLDLYYRTVGLGANTIINLAIDDRGVIPDNIAAAAKAFGDEVRRRFSDPIAKTRGIKKGDIVELKWKKPSQINTIVTMENIVNGQKVAKYTLEAFIDDKWQTLDPRNRVMARKPYNNDPGYETIGHKKIDRFSPVVTNRIRFRCLEAITEPVEIRSMAVFNVKPAPKTFDSSYPYLSGIETTYETAHGDMKRDIDYAGNSLEINGRSFKHGIMLCPVGMTGLGIAEFDLKPHTKAKGMKAFIGIEDAVGKNGSCEFIVEGYINRKWKQLYKSPLLKGGDKGIDIEVKFPEGMKELRLKTTIGGDNGNCDHAVWADAKLIESEKSNSKVMFEPTLESLSQYECPEWFRDAKFGIWSHWTGYCASRGMGDWYARHMYDEKRHEYKHHLKLFGHPSEFGYKDVIETWRAENFDPDELISLYKKAGAKYFVALANHHDNFDLWDSKHQKWNSVNYGPKKNIVKLWSDAATKVDMPFGLTSHLERSYTWFQTSHGADKSGPKAGVPYDGANPEYEFIYHEYCADKNKAHPTNAPQKWCDEWIARCKDVIEKYDPILFYIDGGVPFYGDNKGKAGMDVISYLYNNSIQTHGGTNQAVMCIKNWTHKVGDKWGYYWEGIATRDYERGRSKDIRKEPWQTDTSIAGWSWTPNARYRSTTQIIHELVDIVSKNGNLLLNIPQRPDGTLDDTCYTFLNEMAQWMQINSESIYATRPWVTWGQKNLHVVKKDDTLYLTSFEWPDSAKINAPFINKQLDITIDNIELLGSDAQLIYSLTDNGLEISLPQDKPCDHAWVFKITGQSLVNP